MRASTAFASTTSSASVSAGKAAKPTRLNWSITIKELSCRANLPVHPGEILLEEFLSPLHVSQYRLAKDVSVSPRRINEIVRGSRSVSADTALRTAR